MYVLFSVLFFAISILILLTFKVSVAKVIMSSSVQLLVTSGNIRILVGLNPHSEIGNIDWKFPMHSTSECVIKSQNNIGPLSIAIFVIHHLRALLNLCSLLRP
jgi:hypothetical protein